MVSSDRLFQGLRSFALFAQQSQRGTQVIERCCPVERNPVTPPFLQNLLVGLYRFFEKARIVFLLTQGQKDSAQVVLGAGPLVWRLGLRVLFQC